MIALSLKKHAGIPPDLPLAQQLTRSGVVLPLALLAFATFFGAPVISALVAGDIVATEDANNTLKMILTRSTGRGTIYAAKALAAATYGIALIAVMFLTSIIGSIASWGLHGVTLLNGRPATAGHALALDAYAYAAYLLPLAVLVAVAFFLSTATRNSAAAIVGTVIFALAFQGIAALPGLQGAKPYLLPQQFDAWRTLFGQTAAPRSAVPPGSAPSTASSRSPPVGRSSPAATSPAPEAWSHLRCRLAFRSVSTRRTGG